MDTLLTAGAAERVRQAAAEALGRIRSKEAVPALLTALGEEKEGDDSLQVRIVAASALGNIGDPRAIPQLGRIARDIHADRWLLGYAAKSALQKMDTEQARAELEVT